MADLLVVCHQIRSPENLGAVARLMANYGLDQLILSDPATHDFRGAERLAVGAEGVLSRFAIAPSLPEAVRDAVYVVGTTSRTVLKRFVPLSPEVAMARLAEHAQRGPVALVMGGEKRGLSDDELACCHDVLVIPTPGPQPSMNVAQAAGLLFYLWSRAQHPATPPAPIEGARGAQLQALEALMREVLLACDALNAQAPDHVLKELLRTLVRGGLSAREAGLWRSAFEHLGRAVRPLQ